jgi:AraC-like DNA-binding protein
MTSVTDNAGVVTGVAGRPRHVHPGSAGDSGESWRQPAVAAVRFAQFRTAERPDARRFFAGAYHPGWRMTEVSSRSAVTHRRRQAGAMTIDEVLLQGRVTLEVPPGDAVVVIQPRAGSLRVTGAPFPTADRPVLVAHGLPCAMQVNGARFDVVSIAADVLDKVSTDRGASPAPQPQFLDWRPRSGAAVRAWHRALDYVTATLACPDTVQQPLIVAGLASLLAGVLLECFPSTVTEYEGAGEADEAGEPKVPASLKDGVSFIHRHAGDDIGINDVPAAVHLTPRAVQYLFRRQLDTTPTEYMRRVRLNRAHQELIAGTRSTVTVTEIAQRWGFAHTGRFAVLYRQTYGQSPHTTLRQ